MSTVNEMRQAAVANDWRTWAACRSAPPGVMFPDEDDVSQETAAKAMCAGCPVKAACLEHAVAWNERFGVWGGMTERERRSFRRQVLRGIHERRVAESRGVVAFELFAVSEPVLAPR